MAGHRRQVGGDGRHLQLWQHSVWRGNQAAHYHVRFVGVTTLPMITSRNMMLIRLATARAAVQRGMSMMELMVGLAIGLVLTLGMFTMIVSTSQSFRVNDDFSR